jgi:DNA-binding response OmpR family regulator
MERIKNGVVVIDDDIIITKLLGIILSRAGFKVIEFFDGKNACKWLIDNIPDVIVCDILMPGMDGLDVLKFIRKSILLKNVPVLAVTALVMTGYEEKFLSIGFDAYFPKPVNMLKFVSEVHHFAGLNPRVAHNDKQEANRARRELNKSESDKAK